MADRQTCWDYGWSEGRAGVKAPNVEPENSASSSYIFLLDSSDCVYYGV